MDQYAWETVHSSEPMLGMGLIHFLFEPEDRQILKYDERDELFLYQFPIVG
jgi:hypothetical protein